MDDKQLQELQELRVFVDGVKTRYTKAKKVLDNIESLEVRYQKTNDAVDKIISETGETRTEIEAFHTQAKAALEKIQETRIGIAGHLDSAKESINDLQTLSKNAAVLEGEISGGKREIDALLKNARNLTADIEKSKNSADTSLEKANELLVGFQEKVDLMKNAFVEFTEIKKKIDDKDVGLDAILKLVQKAQAEADGLVAQIKASLKLVQTNEKEIAEIKVLSKSHLDDIKSSLDSVNITKQQVEDVSGLVIDGSFAETFERRKKEISKSLDSDVFSWKYVMLLSIILLVIVEFGLGDLSGVDGFFTRLAYTSPLIFLVLFSAVQYSRDRNFLEKYAFKAASSAAVRNHIDFLVDRFGKTDKKVLDFSIGTFSTIYSEPFKEDIKQSKDLKVEKSTDSKKSFVENGVSNMMDMVDKLYAIIPDETIIKQTVDAVVEKKKK